jgi:restriction system protein
MGYRNKEPYQLHNKEWEDFSNYVDDVKYFVENLHYDGFTRNCDKKSDELKSYLKFTLNEEEYESKSFCLPSNYEIREIADFLEPIEPPEFPEIRNAPSIVLPIQKYPDWYKQYIDRDKEQREKISNEIEFVKEKILYKKRKYQEIYTNLIKEIVKIKDEAYQNNSLMNCRLIEIAHLQHKLPTFLAKPFRVGIDSESKVALIEFEFPDYQHVPIPIGIKTVKYQDIVKYATETARKKIIKTTLYSLIIRAGFLASKCNVSNLYESIVINVEQNWFDPATGQPRNGIIASLQAPVSYFLSLDLSKLDPESCFKYLKGISTPNLQNISPVRPIFTLNRNDERLVESKDVDSYIEPESNLAAMEWEDFEHLVAQLFEWEFSKNGIEVKVTRASRDRGVDAILFDPDPLKGGKYVIQAKRYTRTVDVSAVRDLYGTVMNEGANRGILITTASYGPDAYEFAKDKPISLVDGSNLLLMLQKHGKNFKIDLEEARRLNNEV